jgi:hypothetical protein
MFVSMTAMSLTLKRRAATSARSMTGPGIHTACRWPVPTASPVFGHVAPIEKPDGNCITLGGEPAGFPIREWGTARPEEVFE